jgi:ribosomal peptide maturation radical SAM protein 1
MRIVLVNMPFADWNRPSFALSQLAALTRREFGDEVDVAVRYLNIDFAHYLTPGTYDSISGEMNHLLTGVGEWLFREVAFPDLPDNTDEYFRRYYNGSAWQQFREHLVERRAGLEQFCAELAGRYHLADADIVGFTSMFAQNVASLAMAKVIKQHNPGTITVIGGANCETPMGTVLAEHADAIDFVFSGPALHTFPEFVQHVRDGDLDAVHRIPGVVSTRNAGDEQFAKAMGRERDIDDFFEPDYQDFVAAFDASREALGPQVKPILFFETSRGCWWGQRSHCTFCGLNGLGMAFRAMSPQVALRQFDWLFSHSPWCDEFFCTDNILPRNYPKEVFAHLGTPPGASLFYEVKLPVSEHDMAALTRAGVTKVQPGIEALATETLKLMGKGTTAFLNLQFLKSCVSNGMMPAWNLLVGFPGEREQVYEKYVRDIPLLVHLPPPTGAFMVRFDRYSPYFADPDRFGLDLAPMDYYRLSYPFGPQDLERMAYFFADQNMAPYMFNAIKWLKPVNEEIQKWRSAWESGGPRPQLAVRRGDDGTYIEDTRDGGQRTIAIDDDTYRLLRKLSSPLRADQLASSLDIPGEMVAERLEFLRANGFLFEENDRMLNVVVLDGVTDWELPLVDVSNAAKHSASHISEVRR